MTREGSCGGADHACPDCTFERCPNCGGHIYDGPTMPVGSFCSRPCWEEQANPFIPCPVEAAWLVQHVRHFRLSARVSS